MLMSDGGAPTVTTTTAPANGNNIAICSASSSSNDLVRARIGVLNNDIANTTARTDITAVLYELHFFKGAALADDLTNAQAVIEAMRTSISIANNNRKGEGRNANE